MQRCVELRVRVETVCGVIKLLLTYLQAVFLTDFFASDA